MAVQYRNDSNKDPEMCQPCMIQVTFVKEKDTGTFAFAEVRQHRDFPVPRHWINDKVFLPPPVYQNLRCPQAGQECAVIVSKGSPKGPVRNQRSSSLKADDIFTQPRVAHPDWKLEIEPMHMRLPDTVPGSSHAGVSFNCFVCNTKILSGTEIWKLKRGAIWTRGRLRTVKHDHKQFYNRHKDTNYSIALCSACSSPIGAYYRRPYESVKEEDSDRPFPCYKLDFRIMSGENVRLAMVPGSSKVSEWTKVHDALDKTGTGQVFRTTSHVKHLVDEQEALAAKLKQLLKTDLDVGPSDAPWRWSKDIMDQFVSKFELGESIVLLEKADLPDGKFDQVVHELGISHQVSGGVLVYDKHKLLGFYSKLLKLQERYKTGLVDAFKPRWNQRDPQAQLLFDAFMQPSRKYYETPHPEYSLPVRHLRVFHGVHSEEIAMMILRGDFAALAAVGNRFGAGCYFTRDLEYALAYSKQSNIVLVCDILFGNPFPAVGPMPNEPITPSCDAHVVLRERNGRKFTEIVIADTSQILIRAILNFN